MVRAVKIAQESITTPETLPEIAEEAITIPPEAIETPVEEPIPTEEPIEAEEPAPKRKPGRPVGSKSKVPGKPRAKRAPRAVPVAPQSESEEEEPVEMPRGRRRIPDEPYDHDSAVVLAMLKQQHRARQTRKSDLWRSWFKG